MVYFIFLNRLRCGIIKSQDKDMSIIETCPWSLFVVNNKDIYSSWEEAYTVLHAAV